MLEYLKFLFNNLRLNGQKLSSIAVIQEKFWIRINDKNEKWFFKKNGELIISINGNIINGKYEILNQFNITIGFENKEILLNQNFLYKDILLLKKDSDDFEFYTFYDELKFSPDTFLKFIETSRKKDLNIKQIELVDNTKVEILMSEDQEIISIGNKVLINQQLTTLNCIETKLNFFELENGTIHNIFFKGKYIVDSNINIIVKQKRQTINVNDEIVSFDKPVENGIHKINNNIVIEVKDRKIHSKYYTLFAETHYKKHKIEIWSTNSISFSSGDLVFENEKSAPNGKYWLSLIFSIKVENGKIK